MKKSSVFVGQNAVSAPKKEKKFVSAPAIIAGMSSLVVGATPAFADGGTDLGTLANGWNGMFSNFGKLVLNVCTVGGVGVAASGLLELKRSQDPNNQGRDNAKSAGTKIGVGGGLAAVSQIVNLAIGTTFKGGAGNTGVTQGTVSFQ